MDTELQAIHDVVNEASLSAETRQGLLRALDQLPPLYRELDRTYDIRYRDGIARLVEGMLHRLGQEDATSPDAGKVAEELRAGLSAMHQRLGIPSLGLKPPPAVKRRRPPKS